MPLTPHAIVARSWRHWTKLLPTTPIPSTTPFRKIIVPSMDTVRWGDGGTYKQTYK